MELQILEWINNNLHGSGFINQVIRMITYLGEAGLVWVILGVVLVFFKKTRRCGLLLIAGYCATGLINHFLLKNIINRPRPFQESEELAEFIRSIGMSLPSSSSFPSGHTATSITSAVIITMCFRGKGAWSFIPATLISLSRIFLCVHYPTDVLGGAVIGTLIAILTVWLGNIILDKLEIWWEGRKNKEKSE